MAQRGVVVITDMGNLAETDRVLIVFKYQGFQHADEQFNVSASFTPSITGAGFKANLTAVVKDWYDTNPSANYDEWDGTPITGDTIAVVGGIL